MSATDRKLETRVIDGLEFTCQQSPFERAFPLSTRAGRLFAVNVDRTDVRVSLALGLQAFKADATLLADLLAGTHVILNEGGKLVQVSLASPEGRNRAFTGKIGTAIKAAMFAAEVEFADFFVGDFAAPSGVAEETTEQASV